MTRWCRLVGVPEHAHPSPGVAILISRRASVVGSLIAGIAEAQQLLDFCAGKNVVAAFEMIAAQDIDGALRMNNEERCEVSLRYPRCVAGEKSGDLRTQPDHLSASATDGVARRHAPSFR
jgi:hypothetical protein